MHVPIFQVDAFTKRRFAGNPAAVMVFAEFPDDSLLQSLAAENNLAETAFLVPDGEDYRLRWFTPTVEVPLCGHATLASAAVVLDRLEPGRRSVLFHSASGPLTVRRSATGFIMDFPSHAAAPLPAPDGLADALGVTPSEVWGDQRNYLALLADAAQVRALTPDLAAIARYPTAGVLVTARGDEGFDFVSRYFAPAHGIPEDPVTGSAHCMLAPFWAARLGKSEFRAFQASPRGGEVLCRIIGDRIELEGQCVHYFEGVAEL